MHSSYKIIIRVLEAHPRVFFILKLMHDLRQGHMTIHDEAMDGQMDVHFDPFCKIPLLLSSSLALKL